MPSSAANTPFSSPDMIRKAPMYWPTRFSITVQPAITTSGVMNEFSRMNSIEMPSTPRW